MVRNGGVRAVHVRQDRVHARADRGAQRGPPVGRRVHRDDLAELGEAQLAGGGLLGGGVVVAHREPDDERSRVLVQPERAGHQVGARPPVEQAGDQIPLPPAAGRLLAAAADEVSGRHPGGADQHVRRALGERLSPLLHPDRAELARARVDADRQPAPDAQLGVLVDVHDVLAGAQPVEDAPLAQHPQVVRGALAAEDREPAQLVDLRGVGVRAGVGEHPARGVLDADDAAGEQRDRLGEREQVARAVVARGAAARASTSRASDSRRSQRTSGRTSEQRDAGLRCGRTQHVRRAARLHRHRSRAPAGRPRAGRPWRPGR